MTPETSASAAAASAAAPSHEFIEGVKIRLAPAPVGRRISAALIDIGIVSVVMWLVAIPFAALLGIFAVTYVAAKEKAGDSGALLFLIILIVLVGLLVLAMLGAMHAYFIYYEFKKGATPGKRILGLRVVSLDGKRLTRGQAIYRDVVRWYVDGLLFIPAFVSIYLTEKRQRVGDLLAGTMVVYSAGSEDKDSFLYVKREDYLALTAHLEPQPVHPDVCEKYLVFANQAFLLGQEAKLANERTEWLTYVRHHLAKSAALGLNDLTVLRYFAEFCFQSDLKRRTKES
jgi:uncharacterized RDD family membrane protein YckC